MAIIYVGTEHKTISAAIQAAKDGDTVVVSGGVYRERVNVDRGITVIAAEGETPIIDGGWNGEETGSLAPQLAVTGRGARVSGLTIRNWPGRGVLVNADGATVTACRIDRLRMAAGYVEKESK